MTCKATKDIVFHQLNKSGAPMTCSDKTLCMVDT